MSGFFDEKTMLEKLNQFVPEGETLIAGVKAIGNSMEVRQCFSYVTVLDDDTLTRSEVDPSCVYDVQRNKYATHDIYIGITNNYLVFNECELYKHAFFVNKAKPGEFVPVEVKENVSIRGFGHAQELKNIKSVKIKSGLLGQKKCVISFNNGSCFKFSIPKKAGVGNGMPHHKEYRDKIVEVLKAR